MKLSNYEIPFNSEFHPRHPLIQWFLVVYILFSELVHPHIWDHLFLVVTTAVAFIYFPLLAYMAALAERMLAWENHNRRFLLFNRHQLIAYHTCHMSFNNIEILSQLRHKQIGPLLGLFGAFHSLLNLSQIVVVMNINQLLLDLILLQMDLL